MITLNKLREKNWGRNVERESRLGNGGSLSGDELEEKGKRKLENN